MAGNKAGILPDNDDDDLNIILYKDRPDWKDISPLSQDDGTYPVVQIAYTEAFRDVYDYFRAIVAKGELSERALLLTEDAIHLNAANYTVWQYRRKIIKHINYDLNEELDFCREMIEMNPKNYQVWHHRRMIVEWLNDPSKELRLTRIILNVDAKNYHAWEHRQWVLNAFNIFENELNFVDELIEEDIRNNSAWNQRYFVILRTTGFTPEVIQREVDYATKAINILNNNESPWNYLKGVLGHSTKRLSEHGDIEKWCWDLHKLGGHKSSFLLSFLIDMLEDKIELNPEERGANLEMALKLCDSLATEHDQIRQEYWRFISRKISNKFNVLIQEKN